MVTIEAYINANGQIIKWLYDGANESDAVRKARTDAQRKGLVFNDSYIII